MRRIAAVAKRPRQPRFLLAGVMVIVVFSPSAIAADDFPLTLQVLGTSERSQEYKRIYPDPCIKAALGVPCRDYEQSGGIPGWSVDVLQVTGRLTQRGRTVEYQLECRAAAPKRPCAPMKYGKYPARWKGKRLEVLITDGSGKGTINHFQIKGEHDANPN